MPSKFGPDYTVCIRSYPHLPTSSKFKGGGRQKKRGRSMCELGGAAARLRLRPPHTPHPSARTKAPTRGCDAVRCNVLSLCDMMNMWDPGGPCCNQQNFGVTMERAGAPLGPGFRGSRARPQKIGGAAVYRVGKKTEAVGIWDACTLLSRDGRSSHPLRLSFRPLEA
ncbi:hypothetical protein BJV74DRAFT_858533 [Russula compacta]|nr:hypothetical protein BJV74DRAFT_858533 [Russula compacta]